MALWTPALLDGATLVAWLDASQQTPQADGTIVLSAEDHSPNGNDFAGEPESSEAPVSNAAPTYETNVLDGKPAFLFTNLGAQAGWWVYFKSGVLPTLTQPLTSIVVAKPLAVGAFSEVEDVWTSLEAHGGASALALTRYEEGNWNVFSYNGATMTTLTIGTDTSNAWQIVVAVIDGANSHGSLDGVVSGATTLHNEDLTQGVVVGYDPVFGDNHFDDHMAEVAFVNGALATAQRQVWEGYLAHKWGLEANLDAGHPYAATAPQLEDWPAGGGRRSRIVGGLF